MGSDNIPSFSVANFVAVLNQILDYSFPVVRIVGEVASFKINQDKFIFFDLKEADLSLNCFMMKFKLRVGIKDGDKVVVLAKPTLTRFGKFSLTIEQILPLGEGNLKKQRNQLYQKLFNEGLFAPERKRLLPSLPEKIGVISSVDAAGYKDFIRIISERWRGLNIVVKNTTVQGNSAPAEIMTAVDYFNQLPETERPDLIAIIRGGGSKDDLSCFDDEMLVRAVAASAIPVATGIGHDVDTSLVDLAADLMAATPSHLAQILVPDLWEFQRGLSAQLEMAYERVNHYLDQQLASLNNQAQLLQQLINGQFCVVDQKLVESQRLLQAFDPQQALRRGYAIVRGNLAINQLLEIETKNQLIKAEVKEIYDKNY